MAFNLNKIFNFVQIIFAPQNVDDLKHPWPLEINLGSINNDQLSHR